MEISRSTVPVPKGQQANGDVMHHRRTLGFSMVELMVTVAIAAVLLALGVPSFQSLIASQKVKAAASSLQVSLNMTRSEALKRNATVTLAPNSSTDWTTGWKIVDPGTGVILFTTAAVSVVITGPASVKYRGSGRIDATLDGKFQFSGTDTTEVRCVEVDLSGSSTVTRGVCS